MKIIEKKFNRFGEPDYDIGYIDWGFDPLPDQILLAEKLQQLFQPGAKRILDVACGIAHYHRVWLDLQYQVTGLDISETFIANAKEYYKAYAFAEYLVCGFDDLNLPDMFDVAVFIDPVNLSGKAVKNIYRALCPGGRFIYEMWNENYYKYHDSERHKDHQTWSCKDGVYRLVRHMYNKATSIQEHEEIVFDVPNDTMIHSTGLDVKYVNMHCCIQFLEAAGFENVRFADYDGNAFDPSDDQVKRFFLIGEK